MDASVPSESSMKGRVREVRSSLADMTVHCRSEDICKCQAVPKKSLENESSSIGS